MRLSKVNFPLNYKKLAMLGRAQKSAEAYSRWSRVTGTVLHAGSGDFSGVL